MFFYQSQGQPVNDLCAGAARMCPGSSFSGTTVGAGTECGGAEGDCIAGGTWGQCYDVDNSSWSLFTTNNDGGTATFALGAVSCLTGTGIDFSLIHAPVPCDPTSYVQIHCEQNVSSGSNVNLSGLLPNTTYYIHFDGAAGSECDFEANISGEAVNVDVFTSTTPANCGTTGGSITVDSISGAPGPYDYSLNGEAAQTSNNFTDLPAGGHTVTVTDSLGCDHTNTTAVNEINNILEANAGSDVTTLPGNTIPLNGSGTGEFSHWSPSIGIADSTTSQTSFYASSPGVYTYTFTTYTSENCQATDQVIIIVLPPVFVYNAFTPNGDGVNDTWQITNANLYPEMDVNVYTKWGQRIYHETGYDNLQKVFDGTHMGALLPVGVYYYTIDLNSGYSDDEKTERLAGSLTIMR